MSRWHAVLWGIVALAHGCTNYDPGKIALNAASPEGVILMKLTPSPIVYSLTIQKFDAPNQRLLGGSFSGGWANFEELSSQPYVAKSVAPGTYVVTSLAQQTWWTACFQDGTYSFEVKPGEVVYLGTFNALPSLVALSLHVKREGPSMTSRSVYYFDRNPVPNFSFSANREAELAQAQGYVKAQMPHVDAPVALAELHATKFGTGSDAFGLQRVCGGYYKQPPSK
ncbi:MAG TPA: hypothetical protein VJM78_03415 [Rhizomicrobium sp.]|nr:hypothetical protein [Rhizomicrobium sp.]